jgi:hypothetical protein
MNKIVISKLISIANQFDSMGNYEDADRLSDVAGSFQAPNKEDIDARMDQSFENSDDYQALQDILEDMLNSGELSPEQKSEIENIIGDDSSAIDFSNDEDDDSIDVKELSNPIDGEEMMPDDTADEMDDTDIEKPSEEDLESLFADDPELLEWWRNLGSNNNE